jgi:putative heme-binding domain-containing protein
MTPMSGRADEESDGGKPATQRIPIESGQRVALVGNSLAERMNLFGNFEAIFHLHNPDKEVRFRNFGWPADEVGIQQRPGNYTEIDDPLEVFGPDLLFCFFGFNESFAGTSAGDISRFKQQYQAYLERQSERFKTKSSAPKFVLVSPIAFESSGNPLQPDGTAENERLQVYASVIAQLADQLGYRYVDLFAPTRKLFSAEPGLQYTINGIHLNERGDLVLAKLLEGGLFPGETPVDVAQPEFAKLKELVNDKSWMHLQDYRMLNGWYVYGGRRTWDTETFPKEYVKIRNMVKVRDALVWDAAQGKPVPDKPDDSGTGEVFIPETMFGTRNEGFRRGREPETLVYPTPQESIAQMTMPAGFEVREFASEQDFPELANPTQINFDNRGRLWVSCMVSYPQWLPGTAKPTDRLLILEDTDQDGKADTCKTFYDKLACPTGFEFYDGGVLVVDEPRILFLKDTDGDDVADEVTQIIDGIGTDDTHHAMGAWEFSHGGLLHMLEGVSMSTTLETPYGPFRVSGPSGAYVWDPLTLRIRHFRTPAYGNPWCLVFDRWGNAIIGDGTGATHHWGSPLSGADVPSRKTLRPIFNNEGMRPAVGNDFLKSRHFPPEVHDHFIYGCVINMHGFPRFTIFDESDGAGMTGNRIDDLLASSDMFFRPVDPRMGPDGALWFGDWCNALIGHMQYSQRDPNRDHEHGRIYRMVYTSNPLVEPELQAGQPIEVLLDQLLSFEPRTRYRARAELRDRDKQDVFAAIDGWLTEDSSPEQLCEAMWIQESFRDVDPGLLQRILSCDDFHARAAAVHTISNEQLRLDDSLALLARATADSHPRVRLEALRGLSFVGTARAAEVALNVYKSPVDYWIEYTLEHTLQALEPAVASAEKNGTFLVDSDDATRRAYEDYKYSTGPGKAVYKPLRAVTNVDLPMDQRHQALDQLAVATGGDAGRGEAVFTRVCAACHQIGDVGKEFGPKLDDLAMRMGRREIIESVVWPNEKISKGFETVAVVTDDGRTIAGFILREDDDTISLGVANGKVEVVEKDIIEFRQEKKASSMPEGLTDTIAPIEFLDLIQYLTGGWIDTAQPEVGKLRKHGPFVEVSRQARLRIGDDYPAVWNADAAYLLSDAPQDRDFAFHSNESSSEPPAIQIRLPEPKVVRHVSMQNRKNSQYHDRAKDLTVWVSEDGKSWRQVWQSDKPQLNYEVDVPQGPPVSFVKIGLPRRGILHLNQVVVFGE